MSLETKSMNSEEYYKQKKQKIEEQEWVPVFSKEGLLRKGSSSKNGYLGFIYCYNIETKKKEKVSKDEYKIRKNIDLIILGTKTKGLI